MPRSYPADMPWVIVRLNGQPFALPSVNLRELVVVDRITTVAQAPAHVRGVVNLRGAIIPVVDLRRRLGMPSALDEAEAAAQLMVQRAEDHRRWLAELEASLEEKRPFTLTTDPHACAFGRWYDSYRTDDTWVHTVLVQLDAPHQRIHQLGVEVEQLKGQGQYAAARALLADARAGDLAQMLKLFSELQALVVSANRETLAVLNVDGKLTAATVDAALAVEKLSALEPLPASAGIAADGLVVRSGRRSHAAAPVMVVECEHLMQALP